MGTLLDRISELAGIEQITIGGLEKQIGASKGVLSRAIQNNTDIQAKWIVRIVENYPRYSADWLLAGVGSMFKNSKTDERGIPVYYFGRQNSLEGILRNTSSPQDYISIPGLSADGAIAFPDYFGRSSWHDYYLFKLVSVQHQELDLGKQYIVSFKDSSESNRIFTGIFSFEASLDNRYCLKRSAITNTSKIDELSLIKNDSILAIIPLQSRVRIIVQTRPWEY